MSATTPLLRTIDLVVGHRPRRNPDVVLAPLNLTARGGQLVCVLGANGSGKSTLLRTLVRLQPPLGGRIEVAGVEIADLRPSALARLAAVVLTERVVVDALRVRTAVALGRFAHSGWWGVLRRHDQETIENALSALNVAHLADRDFNMLSDGERQRVMIARALAQQPSLLILDEPTAFLDIAARAELWRLLRHIATDHGLSIVASTHDLEWALRAADDVWLIMPDRTVAVGRPDDLVSRGVVDTAFGLEPSGGIQPIERVAYSSQNG